MVTPFANAVLFLDQLGFYEVVIPFLLTFSIVFAILEKTKIFGMEKIDNDKMVTKKNINSLVAFCVGFIVIASGQLVSIINKTVGQMVLLFVIAVFYITLIGVFYNNDEDVFIEKGHFRTFFMVATLVGILLIFANAVTTSSGETWLHWLYRQIFLQFNTAASSTVVLLVIIIIAVAVITHSPKKEEKK